MGYPTTVTVQSYKVYNPDTKQSTFTPGATKLVKFDLYIKGVVLAEIGNPDETPEAMKAQALAAIAFALVKIKDGTISGDPAVAQAYTDEPPPAEVVTACNAVLDSKEVLRYEYTTLDGTGAKVGTTKRLMTPAFYTSNVAMSRPGELSPTQFKFSYDPVQRYSPTGLGSVGNAYTAHGVGMNQGGAIALAGQGLSPLKPQPHGS